MTIEDLISHANPVKPDQLPAAGSAQGVRVLARVSTAAPQAAVSQALSRLAGRAPGRDPGRPVRPAARRLLPGLALTGALATVAAAVIVTQSGPGQPEPLAKPSGPVAITLTALALTAARQPVTAPPGPGQFQYTKSQSQTEADIGTGVNDYYAVTYVQNRQIWIGPDGSGRLIQSGTDPRLVPGDRNRAAWIAAGRPSLASAIEPMDMRFGPGGLSPGPANLQTLPTDPATLAALIAARKVEGGPPGPAEDFTQIGDLLRETAAPPALRAALFKVAASLPGVKSLGQVTDRLNRTAVAVAYVSGPLTGADKGYYSMSELYFDPQTSQLLDEQTVLVNQSTGQQRVTGWTSYLESAVVNSIPPGGSELTGPKDTTASGTGTPSPSGSGTH